MTGRMKLYVGLLALGLLLVGVGTWLLFTHTGASTTSTYIAEDGVINIVIDDAPTLGWTGLVGFVLLPAVMAVPFLVWSDARRKGASRRDALLWAAASFVFVPFGLILYLLLRRSEPQLEGPG